MTAVLVVNLHSNTYLKRMCLRIGTVYFIQTYRTESVLESTRDRISRAKVKKRGTGHVPL